VSVCFPCLYLTPFLQITLLFFFYWLKTNSFSYISRSQNSGRSQGSSFWGPQGDPSLSFPAPQVPPSQAEAKTEAKVLPPLAPASFLKALHPPPASILPGPVIVRPT
jgi:hypothetical protein